MSWSSSTSPRPRSERGTLLDIVERTARRAFIPLTVGGGVRTVEEMRDVLRAGADKVSLNTRAVAEPDLIGRCAARFGSQAVVVAIDARRVPGTERRPGGPAPGSRSSCGAAATRSGSTPWTGPMRAVALGAGELLVTSIDRDGTGSASTRSSCVRSSSRVEVPVIASGGAAGPEDFVAAVRDGGADAVLAASIFHRREVSIAAGQGGDGRCGPPGPRRRRTEPPHDEPPSPVSLDRPLDPAAVAWDPADSCRRWSRTSPTAAS